MTVITVRRVATGVWAAAAAAGVFAFDWALGTHWGVALLVTAIACASVHELYGMFEAAGIACHRAWGTGVVGAALLARAAGPDLGLGAHEARELSLAVLAAGFAGPFLAGVARADREVEADAALVRRAGATALGLGYVGLLATFLLELRMLGDGPGSATLGLEMAFLLCACVKVGDSAAYFVGRTVGRTMLSPVSPKKTWEGSAGSVAASVGTAVVVGSVLLDHDPRVMAGFGLVVDLAGQGGDLLESYVKRVLGSKDSSATFGEMGGVLDVADALLLAAPAAWLWAALLVAR